MPSQFGKALPFGEIMPLSDQVVSEDRYVLIPRVLVFIISGDKVLLIKGSPEKKLWAGLYNGLGGHVECGENFLSAASRELEEESGLTNIHLHLCGTITIDLSLVKGVVIFIFQGEYNNGDLLDSAEGKLEWVHFNSVENLQVVEDLKTILPIVRKWKPGLPPFFANYHYDQEDRLVITFSRET